ncbi:pentapeptide repeat-containing protein [Streptomyces sp. NBC_00291]|uniref:pentapeptide repeat-containing protein n=2 Tax=Streptomyces sp. NBC_00291 TaxID=2975704 RepID=UPI0022539DA8|nr:pentapeptide repeat-containing protein [Streptomyces sp. NBC_00291]MCX5156037.1 pentapeptide repeat-containing protein [Streptomyces sp. NBC_00291]
MPGIAWALLGFLILLGVLGATGAVFAWRMAVREPEREPRIEVLAGIGGGLITGIAIGVSALFLDKQIEESQLYATWRANVEISDAMPGFTPGNRDIDGIHFSGKLMHNADFRGVKVRDGQFQDARLERSHFENAKMQGANLLGANLYEASLIGTNLDGADLRSANLTLAVVNGTETSFKGAKVDGHTCWPEGIDEKKLDTVIVTNEDPDDFRGGEKAPHCTLWKGGERTR